MTMIRAIGAETGSPLEFDAALNVSAVTTAGKVRSGTYCFNFNSTGYGRILLTAAEAEIFMQFTFHFTGGSPFEVIRWKLGATVLGCVWWNSPGQLAVYTGNKAVLIGSSKPIANATLYLVELRILIGASGVIELRLDTISQFVFSGNTRPGSEANLDAIDFQGAVSWSWDSDDIIINNPSGAVNNSWPGGARIVMLLPNGAGSSTQWTPTAGANYQCVDELPPVMTDNNGVNTDAQLDLFALGNLPADAAAVKAIMPTSYALKTGAPAVANLKTAYKVSGFAARLSSNKALSTSMAQYANITEINPETSNPFTPAEVNALEGGYQSAT